MGNFSILEGRFFRRARSGPAILGAVAVRFILVQGATTYRTYFHKWATPRS